MLVESGYRLQECGYFAEEREYMVVEHGNMILLASVFSRQPICNGAKAPHALRSAHKFPFIYSHQIS